MLSDLLDKAIAALTTAFGHGPNPTPDYIAEEIHTLRDSQQDTPRTLLLTPRDTRDRLQTDVDALTDDHATIEPAGERALRVTLPEHQINALCSLTSLKAIDLERDATNGDGTRK